MEDLMNRKRLGLLGVVTSAALAISVGVVPAAHSATHTRTILIWADDTRGPALAKLIPSMKAAVPGYNIVVKSFASYTAEGSAWDIATAATGPDIILYDGSLVFSGGKSGKIYPLALSSATKASFSKAAWAGVTFKGKIFGIPTDADVTGMIYNTALVSSQPKTIQEMYDYYMANKVSKGLTNGICSFNGTWGSQAILTALGGGTWAYKANGQADLSKVVYNSPAFKANVKKYLLGPDGKTNGFFSYDGCDTAFKAGKVPFAQVGAWNMDSIQKAGISYAWGSVPGTVAGTFGHQWVGYPAAYLTAYAVFHSVKTGSLQLLNNWFASEAGQLALDNAQATPRPLAHLTAAGKVKDKDAAGLGLSAANAVAQLNSPLGDNTGGANWYDVSDASLKALFAGKPIDATLDNAAKVLAKDFAHAAKN
jgi:maltose-binding protein MalE